MYPEECRNTGVISVLPKPSDFVAGEETGIKAVVRNPSGKWRTSEPPGEWQKFIGYPSPQNGFNTGGTDVLACVSFSANNALETLGNFLVSQSEWNQESLQWLKDNGYFNKDGSLDFSDRFTAKVSGTTKNGNSLPAVWDAIRNNGLVPESVWAVPFAEMKAPNANVWDIYYKPIPAEVLALGKEFKKRFDISYEWVILPGTVKNPSIIQEMLKVAPLQLATRVCGGWNNTSPIKGCGAGSEHATMMSAVGEGGSYWILDHYVPFDKLLGADYDITYAMRGVIAPRVAVPTPAFSHEFNVNLNFGMGATDEVHFLQEALQILGYMKPGLFGPFGPQTQTALAAFQKANGIVDVPIGTHFGPKTRAKLNSLI